MILREFSLALLGSVLLTSCGMEGGDVADETTTPTEGFEMRSGDLFDDDSQKMLSRYGSTNPLYAKDGQSTSASEAATVNNQFSGEFSKRDFKAKDYWKKAFWGSKDYAKQVFQGDLDGNRFQTAARESSSSAREGSMTSREAGRNFATSEAATSSARESGQAAIPRTSDAETDFRRKVFTEPEVRDWNRRGLSVDDTRSLLGR